MTMMNAEDGQKLQILGADALDQVAGGRGWGIDPNGSTSDASQGMDPNGAARDVSRGIDPNGKV
jgi:hypothetical protein